MDATVATRQHTALVETLRGLGVKTTVLPPLPGHPDAPFVEDAVVVLPEVVVRTRSGAASRQGEFDSLRPHLPRGRLMVELDAPATLDGGDVLVDARRVLVGRSSRTNAAGVEHLRRALSDFDYEVLEIPVDGVLHLKTALTRVSEGLYVHAGRGVDRRSIRSALGSAVRLIDVDGEASGANVLAIPALDGAPRVALASSAPRTALRLQREGVQVHPLDLSEFEKAEAGVTCLALLWQE